MRNNRLLLIAAAAMLLPACAALAEPGTPPSTSAAHKLEKLQAVPLQAGINAVEHFTVDGRPARIALGWRGNGNAASHHVMLVLVQAASGKGWDVVTVDGTTASEPASDTVADAPHTGEDVVKAVRLVRGIVDGKPAMLLLTATRLTDAGTSLADPSPTRFEVYRLETGTEEPGTAPEHFSLLQQSRSSGRFCNADMALHRQYGLPLSARLRRRRHVGRLLNRWREWGGA